MSQEYETYYKGIVYLTEEVVRMSNFMKFKGVWWEYVDSQIAVREKVDEPDKILDT